MINKLLLVLWVTGTLFALPAHALFKCVDAKGLTHYGDTMPEQCATKAITEMSGKGNVVKKIDAPLTPEQIKVRETEVARLKIENAKIADVKRVDMALLATYASEKEFDLSRERDLAQLETRVKSLKQLAIDSDAQLVKINNEMEFYKAGKSKASQSREPPASLVQKLKLETHEREGITTELAKLEKDKEAIALKFETNKQRWKLLKGGLPAGTLTPPPATTADATATKAAVAAPVAAVATPAKK